MDVFNNTLAWADVRCTFCTIFFNSQKCTSLSVFVIRFISDNFSARVENCKVIGLALKLMRPVCTSKIVPLFNLLKALRSDLG